MHEPSKLVEGARRIAQARDAEASVLRRAWKFAQEALEQTDDDGIRENDLIDRVTTELGVTLDIASYVVLELRSHGLARKNRQTGFLYRVAPSPSSAIDG